MKKNILSLLSVSILSSLVVSTQNAQAGLMTLSNQELSDVSARSSIPQLMVSYINSINQIIQNQQTDAQFSEDDLKTLLNDVASTFGLRLEDVQISGIQYGGVTATISENGSDLFPLSLPSYIKQISIGAIKVNGDSPANKSFGSIQINDINLTGTSFKIDYHH